MIKESEKSILAEKLIWTILMSFQIAISFLSFVIFPEASHELNIQKMMEYELFLPLLGVAVFILGLSSIAPSFLLKFVSDQGNLSKEFIVWLIVLFMRDFVGVLGFLCAQLSQMPMIALPFTLMALCMIFVCPSPNALLSSKKSAPKTIG